MGFRSLEEFNDALLAKQGWRIFHNPQALWVQVLKSRYFPHCSFLQATRGGSPSWIWSSLLAARPILQAGSLWQIGDGNLVNFWNDI